MHRVRVGKHFYLDEFLVTKKKGHVLLLPYEYIANVKYLVDTLLEPVREKYGPVVITSGYRSVDLNKALKGAINSAHLTAEAVDFYCPDALEVEVADFIRQHIDHQYIHVYEDGHIHVTCKKGKKRLVAGS